MKIVHSPYQDTTPRHHQNKGYITHETLLVKKISFDRKNANRDYIRGLRDCLKKSCRSINQSVRVTIIVFIAKFSSKVTHTTVINWAE